MGEPTTAETDTNAHTDTLNVYLAKYGSLRGETAIRFEFQAQAYNFLVVVLTAAAVAGASLLGSGPGVRFAQLVLILPLVAGPLSYLYVRNDLMIFGIAGYLDRKLSRVVSHVLGRDVVLSDARLDALSPRGRTTLAALAYGRWLLFVVPTVALVVDAALATDMWRRSPVALLFAADCLFALGLLAAIWVTAREQSAWRRQHARLLAAVQRDAAEPLATTRQDAGGA